MSGKETFLARRRHCDKQTIRATVDNIFYDPLFLIGAEITVSQSSKLYCRKLFHNRIGCIFKDVFRCAKQKWSKAVVRTDGKDFLKQVDTGHPLLHGNATQTRSKDNSHPINADEVTFHDIRAQNGIRLHVDKFSHVESYVLETR